MIDVENEVKIYKINGDYNETDASLKVRNHWSDNDFITLEVDDKTITILAADLKAAIQNATNVNRY
jgi:ribosomal protein L25 (general stress protein Ctc)